MKILLLTLLVLYMCGPSTHAQAPAAADSLRAQGDRMVKSLLTGDYKTFIHYVHPKVVDLGGGAAKLKQTLDQLFRQFNAEGISFQSVTLDSLSDFVKVGTQLQATIRQHTTMKYQQGQFTGASTIIGVSEDNGIHWKFVDTHNKTSAQLRQILPNLSRALVLPPQ